MGDHAFQSEPEHRDLYRRALKSEPSRLIGFREGWDMPVARHRAALSGEEAFDGVPHWTLTYHISGAMVRRIDATGPQGSARTGAISLQRPGSGGRFASEGGAVVDYAHFYFQSSLLDAISRESESGPLQTPEHDFFGLVDRCLQRDIQAYLDRASDQLATPGVAEMDRRSALIICGLVDFLAQRRQNALPASSDRISGRTLNALRDHILARLCETIAVDELADIVGISPSHFSRSFKKATGETPAAYVMMVRLDEARRLLEETEQPLSAIAFTCGFSSQAHLTRRFKARFGLPPGRFRDVGEG